MDNKERIKYFYETITSNNLIDEVPEYVSDDCTIRVGEKIGTASATTYVTSCTYNSATSKTTIGLLAGLGNAIVETKLLATIFDPLYATNDQNGDVPFQLIPNGAKVGQVVSGIAAYIKLNA